MSEQAYDSILILSFGGPESEEEVIPFLENVLRGKNVPRQRMLEVAEHYYHFGGRSPINRQNRELVAALQDLLKRSGPDLPLYWGNRNWHPLLADTLRKMRDEGRRRALAFATSAFSSYSGCRQYREDIARAQAEVAGAPRIDKLRIFYNHPRFIGAMRERVGEAFACIPAERRESARLLYTAHSVPIAMARGSRYVEQLEEACRLVSEGVRMGLRPTNSDDDPVTDDCSKPGRDRKGADSGLFRGVNRREWKLVYQSRSGAPGQPWLEPDILDALRDVAAAGESRDVVIAPIGFLSDHMEVLYDLDTEARARAGELDLNMVRAGTPGVHPMVVEMIRELILERVSGAEPRALGRFGAEPEECPEDCCPALGRGTLR